MGSGKKAIPRQKFNGNSKAEDDYIVLCLISSDYNLNRQNNNEILTEGELRHNLQSILSNLHFYSDTSAILS